MNARELIGMKNSVSYLGKFSHENVSDTEFFWRQDNWMPVTIDVNWSRFSFEAFWQCYPYICGKSLVSRKKYFYKVIDYDGACEYYYY